MLDQWLATIEKRMAEGETFDLMEDEINADLSLDDEQKAALWLFAWSCQSGPQQRILARQHFYYLGVEVSQ
jgi:hypothetical protein